MLLRPRLVDNRNPRKQLNRERRMSTKKKINPFTELRKEREKLATQPEEPYIPFYEYQLKDGRKVTYGVADSKGRYGWVFKDTLKPVTEEDIKGTNK